MRQAARIVVFAWRRSRAALLGTAVGAMAAVAQSPAPALPTYAIKVRLQYSAPRLSAEATVDLSAPDSGRAAFVLAEMFTLESVEIFDGNAFRPTRMDSTFLPGMSAGWGNVRWQVPKETNPLPRGANPLSLRIRYRLDTAATAFVFGISHAITFASGINTAWYPQIEDGKSSAAGRVRTKRGTGTLEFAVPDGVTVYSVGAPSRAHHSFDVREPAYFNFAAARYHVQKSDTPTDATPPTATYYLTPRDSAGSYAAKSLAVVRALAAEFGAYPFPRFALVEIPTGIADSAGFGGASADGAIFTTSQFLDQPFNAAYYGHEIGHQWWGVTTRPTGSRGSWMLSEGIAQYGALRAVEALEGSDAARNFRLREYPGYFGQGGELYFRTVAQGHDAPLADLPGEAWSRDLADSKGFMSLNALAHEIGPDRLRSALHAIGRDFRERRLSWDDFLAAVTRAAGRDMSWFYTQWFDRTGAPELVAEPVDSGRQVRVLQPRDPYRLTVELAIVGSGCAGRSRITVTAREERVPLPDGCRADSLVVDPDYQILRWTPELRARFDKRD